MPEIRDAENVLCEFSRLRLKRAASDTAREDPPAEWVVRYWRHYIYRPA